MEREWTGVSRQLWQQVDKWYRMTNLGSKTTRRTHRDKMATFVDFVGREFKLQNLKNLSDKHMMAYLAWAKQEGYSASTIQNTLSAVRYFHKQLPQTRYTLSENKALAEQINARQEAPQSGTPADRPIPQRHYLHTGKNVGWTPEELKKALDTARSMKRIDVELAMRLARSLGLRIHEVTKLERLQIIRSLEDGHLTVKGKGGLIRDIPLSSKEAHVALLDALQATRPDKQKVFVEKLGNTHKTIASLESWIYRHRDRFAANEERELTLHGLRHSYAQERYALHLRQVDGNEKAARSLTAAELGHGRDWVTRIYLEESSGK